jgi:hypothetical protein
MFSAGNLKTLLAYRKILAYDTCKDAPTTDFKTAFPTAFLIASGVKWLRAEARCREAHPCEQHR